MVRYLKMGEVIFLNDKILELAGEADVGINLKDRSSLEKVIARPRQSFHGIDGYQTMEEKAAALFESLLKDDPFKFGKKRTAFASMYMFLYLNGQKLIASEDEVYELVVGYDEDKIAFSELIDWLKVNTEDMD